MKITIQLLIIITIFSCSHNKFSSHEEDHFSWDQESEKISKDHKDISQLFNWFENHIKEHEEEITNHKVITKNHKDNIVVLKSNEAKNLDVKKVTLELSRLHEEMGDEHQHFLEDHMKLMELIGELEELKNKFESHNGHEY